MKQSFQPAGVVRIVVILLLAALGLTIPACASLPQRSPAGSQATENGTTTDGNWKTDINTASAKEMEKLPGVGEVIAERIVAHRKEHGPFRRVEHLMMVRGISERKFSELRPLITVE